MSTAQPRLVGIGDSVVDMFAERSTAYPGGNALNVAVYWHLFADSPSDFIGVLGDDVYGDHVMATLGELGVGTTRVRRARGQTGRTLVDVAPDGDRVFVASNQGGIQADLSIRLAPADLELIRGASMVHTSVYSGMDHRLDALAQVAPVSYDFSDLPPIESVLPLMPHIQVAFLSAAQLSPEERRRYAQRCLQAGGTAVVMTAGAEGSVGFFDGKEHREGITHVDVVDALGAGDGFITGFLTAWVHSHDLTAAMQAGSRMGAMTCTLPGAFGHGVPASPADMAALKRRSAVGAT